MFLYAGKLLPLFVFPLGMGIAFIIVALILNRSRKQRAAIASAVLILGSFSTKAVADALMSSLEARTPVVPLEKLPICDVIIVLGDFLHAPTPEHPAAEMIEPSDRLLHAARLYRAGKAPLILLSGGVVPFTGKSQSSAGETGLALLVEWGVPAQAILLETQSRNTRENALYSMRTLNPRGTRKILLVNSALQMPRALAAFQKAGFDTAPAPTDFQTGWSNPDFIFKVVPDPDNLDHSTGALKEWLGMAVYKARGWI